MNPRKIVLVGAGNIAHTHAAVLKETPGVQLHGVFDVNQGLARSFAASLGIPNVHATLDAAVQSGADAVHVLSPPDAHLASALPFVEAGMAVLLEKPIGVSSAECDRLRRAAQASGAVIGVNQNFVFNPAYLRLKAAVRSGSLGRPRHVGYVYAAPLRQLSARQFSHWMFRQPINILLEQAVHPLSQIADLAGQLGDLSVLSEPAVEISPGVGLNTALQASMSGACLPAHLRFHVGSNFTVCRMTVLCDDGVAVADMFSNQFHTIGRSAYMEPVDNWLSARATARQIARDGFGGLRDYALSMVKLGPRSDPFFLGMKGSIQSFHADLDAARRPAIDLEFGAHLVDTCERMAACFQTLPAPATVDDGVVPPVSDPTVGSAGTVAVIGATGFIGSHTVAALLAKGYAVRAMARGVHNLQAVFSEPGVTICRGDVKRQDDVARCIQGAQWVVNLAHGGGGADFAAIRAAMVDSAQVVIDACRNAGVQRLVHVGSISSLYLGNASEVVSGSTPIDPLPHTRNDYARAKGLADAVVTDAHDPSGLSVVLLRPGLVVGAGTSPFHGGLGFFNNDQHCVGWNDGLNELPWVLAGDCADAIVQALSVPAASGKAYNLVGDVRPNAREYLRDLAEVTGRPLQFLPMSPTRLWLVEMGKWLIKRVAGRAVPRPYRRDIVSRGLCARFDCGDAKRDLGWQPQSDPTVFRQQALEVHAGH